MSIRWRIATATAVIAVGAFMFIATAVRAFVYDPVPAFDPASLTIEPAATSTSQAPSVGKPARVEIPTLGINAVVEQLGIIAGNRMQAPTNYTDVGWFKYGVVPGMPGTAVMYGHVDNGLGLPGVFNKLNELRVGNEVIITTENGQSLRFAVSDVQIYPYREVPPAALGQGGDQTELRVSFITCSGKRIYDKSMGFTYDHRLVVIAEKI